MHSSACDSAAARELRSRGLVPFSLLALALSAACTVHTDLGKPCAMVKKNPDGGAIPALLTAADVPLGADGGVGQNDLISSGSTDCENFICVLDASNVGAAIQAAGTGGLTGYCSNHCAVNSTCSQQYNDLQNQPGDAMSCRDLLLDQATINAICQDPVLCHELLGNNQSPYFCARGLAPAGTDGGI